ncbi:NUDIX hydrolase [Marivirga tractuosa]|uniref:NUDIX hydrolase n=1 Tax=Marivirga tractuosa (strain ATCC 23168 / DSM 4126 / NBRC 15989 / NCIMB 1408 / VKM B-1430 / H-43) TaxID=643867 RepID=E4TQE3_MARTH|nr:NUDIX domain-containing protein [Marivirga tractuosa]ADR22666.1 NUDIX hydrolase [Marivirga tractuosa DSM 4126]BDD16663.1 NUDIX hydrolase [Marivirga tractuosa]
MTITQNIKVAVDAVVFGYNSTDGLSILLIKRKSDTFHGTWALPGGLVHEGESLEQAVTRELNEETGVSINYLEQLYTFGKPERDPRNRVVSVAYYGLVKPDIFKLKAATDASDVAWFEVKRLPTLAFDHNEIISEAIKRLKGKITYEPIGFELLDEKFPFSELEKLYMTVLDRPLDRRNFKKKIMKFGFLEETNEKQSLSGAGRPGNLFQFNQEKYFQLKKEGINFEI